MIKEELFKFYEDESNSISFSEDSNYLNEENVWKILIVDDDPEIHKITKLVLQHHGFMDKPFRFLSSYSRKEAFEVLSTETDIALVLLDVVMESDDAGLLCVKDIREKLKNHNVRIILRTGQPGNALEERIIVDYDINDYQLKTDLLSTKLFTAVITSLRSYNHLRILNHSHLGLNQIIKGTENLLEYDSVHILASEIFGQLISTLQLDENSLYTDFSSLSAYSSDRIDNLKVIAATGDFIDKEGKKLTDFLSQNILDDLFVVIKNNNSSFQESSYTGYFKKSNGGHIILYLNWKKELCDHEMELMSKFSSNVATVLEKIIV